MTNEQLKVQLEHHAHWATFHADRATYFAESMSVDKSRMHADAAQAHWAASDAHVALSLMEEPKKPIPRVSFWDLVFPR